MEETNRLSYGKSGLFARQFSLGPAATALMQVKQSYGALVQRISRIVHCLLNSLSGSE
jgi:hypothetical protein